LIPELFNSRNHPIVVLRVYLFRISPPTFWKGLFLIGWRVRAIVVLMASELAVELVQKLCNLVVVILFHWNVNSSWVPGRVFVVPTLWRWKNPRLEKKDVLDIGIVTHTAALVLARTAFRA